MTETAKGLWTFHRNPHTDLAYEWFIKDADGEIIGGADTEAHARLFAAGPGPGLVEALKEARAGWKILWNAYATASPLSLSYSAIMEQIQSQVTQIDTALAKLTGKE